MDKTENTNWILIYCYALQFIQTVNGEWKGIRAGGCQNHSTYNDNPKFKLTVDGLSDTEALQIELKAPKQYQVGIEISCVGLNNVNATAKFKSKSSGSYRLVCVSIDSLYYSILVY